MQGCHPPSGCPSAAHSRRYWKLSLPLRRCLGSHRSQLWLLTAFAKRFMQVVSNETPCPASWSSTSQAAAWCSGFRVSHSLPLGPWSQSLLWGRKRERIKKRLCLRAEGLNLSPLFQIIFCLEVSSETSHYLSFKVAACHKIHCPPALSALGLTWSFHTVIPTTKVSCPWCTFLILKSRVKHG